MTVSTSGNGGRKVWQSVGIQTNDPDHRWIEMVVTGRVEKFAEIQPARVRMVGPAGQPLSAVVEIIPSKKYPFTLMELNARSGQYIRYKWEEIRKNNTDQYRITIENTREEKGRYFDTLYVKTDSSIRPVIDIYVTGIIQ